MRIIDTSGHLCPRPVIMLKEALLEIEPGKQLQVITDNETSLKNLLAYLGDQGADPVVKTEGKVHTITALGLGKVAARWGELRDRVDSGVTRR